MKLVVISVTTSSISLSWSVASGTVDHWEVVWSENESNLTSGSITITYYTICQLKTDTSYSITVSATNVIGTTESAPIILNLSTTYSSPCSASDMQATCSNTDLATTIAVGVVAILFMLMLALSVIVIAVLVFKRKCQTHPSALADNRHVYKNSFITILTTLFFL